MSEQLIRVWAQFFGTSGATIQSFSEISRSQALSGNAWIGTAAYLFTFFATISIELIYSQILSKHGTTL